MSEKVEKIVSNLEEVNRVNENLVSLLIDDFRCLDAFQHKALKKQAYKYALAYFEGKYIRSKSSNEKTDNSEISRRLINAIEDWRVAKGDAELNAVSKIARTIFKASLEQLSYVPDNIRVTAFKIVRNFLTEMSQ